MLLNEVELSGGDEMPWTPWRAIHSFIALGGVAMIGKAYLLDNNLFAFPPSFLGRIAVFFILAYLVLSIINFAFFCVAESNKINLFLSCAALIFLAISLVFTGFYAKFGFIARELLPNELAASYLLLFTILIWTISNIAVAAYSPKSQR